MTRSRPTLDVSACLLVPESYPALQPFSWPELFGSARPVELEIGAGKGLFLSGAAAARPEHHFLGIEISRKYARLAAEAAIKRGITNAKVWPGDARAFLPHRVADASLHAVHVYFPDPWWKKRHKKSQGLHRRPRLRSRRCLEPDGELHVATDVEEYFQVMRALIAAEPRFIEMPPPVVRVPEHDLDYLTNFERKFRIEGRAIHRASYSRTEV